MTAPSSNEVPQVADGAQAALLLDVRLRPVLSLLMHSPCSATEVAQSLGITVKRAYYLLTQLEEARIVQVVTLEKKRGRPLRRYGTAQRWLIPFEVTEAETLETFLGEQVFPRIAGFVHLMVRQLQAHSPEWGYWLERSSSPAGSHLRLGDRQGPADDLLRGDEPYLINIGRAHLNAEQATELKRRLVSLLDEFDTSGGGQAPAYTVGLLLVRGDVG